VTLLLDGGGGFEPEPAEDRVGRLAVADRRLGLLAALGLGVDLRALVGEFRRRLSVDVFPTDPQGLVGRREVPVGGAVVGVDLSDRPEWVRPRVDECLSDGRVVGPDLQLDLVHTGQDPRTREKRPGTRPRGGQPRNVVLKSATGLPTGMSDDSEAETADEEASQDDATGLQEGDFVTLAYTARTVDGGDLVDTTSQEVADEEGVGEDQEFEPRTIVLGEGHIFEPVEADIVGKEVGEEGSVVVPAAEAFGEFDDEEVRTISANKIPEDDRYPGAHVDIDGEHGHVETIIGGRARVDFNHPLAGEDVEYEYEILDTVDDREAKAQSLLETMLDMELEVWFETDVVEEEQVVDDPEELEDADELDDEEGPATETVEVEKDTLYIEATPQLSMNQQWMFQKQQIAQQFVDLLGVDRVIVQETLGEGGGMMGGMGGMMGGMGGAGGGDLEEALEDADVDADELAEELDVEE